MTLFRLDASIREEGSVTRRLADSTQQAYAETVGSADVVRRDVGLAPLPADAWSGSLAGDPAARALVEQLADEVTSADVLLFAVPLYNFGVSQHFKAWVDLLATHATFGPGAASRPLEGKPTVLVTARGGGYAEGTPRHGWDHATPWMQRYLGDVLGTDVRTVEAELTLAEVTPAMADLRPLAAQQLEAALSAAARAGVDLAGDRVAVA